MARDARKAQDEERAAKARAKEKEKAAKAKAKAKEKEKAAKAKEKEKAAKAKQKEKAAKAKEKEKAARAKEADREAKAKAKQREAREKEKAREQKAKDARRRPAKEPAAAPQPVEEVAVPERGETDEVPAEVREPEEQESAAVAELVVPDNDKTVRPKGYLAEALGKEDAVERTTQRATLAASYTTRDHELVQAWAHTRNGRPADVKGTAGRRRGPGTAGVLRIEFPDGPGDDSRLEDIDWAPFFETFDASDVDFLYQERVRTGDISRFHKFVRANG